MPKLEVILPKKQLLNRQQMERAIENALNQAAKAVQVDFKVTTQTWQHDVEFKIESSPGERIISTTDEIYGYVSGGTRPHPIVAKPGKTLVFGTPSRAKTTPRVIGSGSGSKGSSIIYTKRVQHPGTQAREFDQVISKKWEKELPDLLQRAIDSEVS